MNLAGFSFFTAFGAGLWIFVLTYLGYLVGANTAMFKQYLHSAVLWTLLSAGILVLVYMRIHKQRVKLAELAGTAADAQLKQ
jgi:membrane protein DedA with SNARE-associated domain